MSYPLIKTIQIIHLTHLKQKKLTSKEIKLQFKPWITYGIRKSIQRRDNIFLKFIKTQDIHIKDDIHKRYKNTRHPH